MFARHGARTNLGHCKSTPPLLSATWGAGRGEEHFQYIRKISTLATCRPREQPIMRNLQLYDVVARL